MGKICESYIKPYENIQKNAISHRDDYTVGYVLGYQL